MNTRPQAAEVVLGERMRARREELGLSQEDAAHLAFMHVSNYGKIERGLINPRLYTLIRIAGVLETDPGTLIEGLTSDMVPASNHMLTAADLIRARADRS